MREQAANLAAIVALSQELAGVPVSQVRQHLCEQISALTRTGVVTLYEPDGQGGLVVTGHAGDGEVTAGSGPGTHSLAGEVLVTATGRFVSSAELEARAVDELAARTGAGWAHLQPVLRDGSVVAVLAVGDRRPRSRPVAGLADFAVLLAAETATALALADLVHALDARARTDELTGLANRRTWDEELPKELARAKRSGSPIAVAILDLDHFKLYNDTFGHPAGDRLLRAVAAGWVSRLRETDLLARYGGEEFGLVLPDCDIAAAHHVLDELRLCMPDGSTCSIGVACWDGRESGEALVSRADAALYEAKRAGRDRVAGAA
jgi:diguanylate cyclase (GGDEF)-like protein